MSALKIDSITWFVFSGGVNRPRFSVNLPTMRVFCFLLDRCSPWASTGLLYACGGAVGGAVGGAGVVNVVPFVA